MDKSEHLIQLENLSIIEDYYTEEFPDVAKEITKIFKALKTEIEKDIHES